MENKLTNKEELLKEVLSYLMELPAYKLRGRKRITFEDYIYKKLKKSTKKEKAEEFLLGELSSRRSTKRNTIEEMYQSPSRKDIYLFSLTSLPHKDKNIGLVALASFLAVAGINSKYPILIVVEAVSMLIFSYSFLIFGIQFTSWQSHTKSTFSIIDRVLENIGSYVNSFDGLRKEDINRKARVIVTSLVEDEISSLYYRLKKANTVHLVFSSLLALSIVLLSGESLVALIQGIANFLKVSEFYSVDSLDIEKISVLVLIPIGFAFSKDMLASNLQIRNECLRRSLVILKENLESEDLQSLNRSLQSCSAAQEVNTQQAAFHQALFEAGLVQKTEKPALGPNIRLPLVQTQGKPVSQTIIEERR